MKVLDLFSGIGGFSLGLERAGMETVAFCEIDPYCRKVLRKHWPDIPVFDDIHEVTPETLASEGIDAIDVVCGGYPCQPFSTAGKRECAEDDRHLWPEMYRIIKAVRPRWVFAENVAGHITMGLDDVLSDLEAEGYTCWSFVIPACAVDARHRRDRVWIVAHSEKLHGDGCGEHSQTEGRQLPQSGECSGSDYVADTRRDRLQRGGGVNGTLRDRLDYAVERGATKSNVYEPPETSGSLNPAWVEWLMGFPTGWTDLEASETQSSPRSSK